MKKILIIRFSSIGDIVLTTPVIRCLKEQMPGAEIHYLTKNHFKPLIQENPYIHKIHTINKSVQESIQTLKEEQFDHIVDLHRSTRSLLVRLSLKRPYTTFNKLNIQKWILVRFKIDRLPKVHIVERYFNAVSGLGILNDNKGLDYFIPPKDQVDIKTLPVIHQKGYIGFSIGGKHNTKIFPEDKVIEVCKKLNRPVVLLGGEEDQDRGNRIGESVGDLVYNSCGKFNINQSASLIKQAGYIITNDTGLMHIAAAFRKKIISIWGNTVPEFGMFPYLPDSTINKSVTIQVHDLKCRPCSKLGYKKCPKGHFDCMKKIDVQEVVDAV